MWTRVAGAWRRAFAVLVTPRTQFRIHLAATGVWAALFVPGLISWRQSVAFVVFCSIYANFASHLSAVVGSLAARKADDSDPL